MSINIVIRVNNSMCGQVCGAHRSDSNIPVTKNYNKMSYHRPNEAILQKNLQ